MLDNYKRHRTRSERFVLDNYKRYASRSERLVLETCPRRKYANMYAIVLEECNYEYRKYRIKLKLLKAD